MSRYYFSIAAIFKNEALGLREWLEHHLLHGCEHFYLINDASTDNFMEVLKPYIDSSIVTLFTSDLPKIRDRQGHAYDKFLKPIWGDTFWLAIIDLDEYVWSPQIIDVRKILQKYENYSQLEINWSTFGSNGHDRQPNSIVEGFTKRIEYGDYVFTKNANTQTVSKNPTLGPKTILNTRYKVPTNFGVHSHAPHEKPQDSYINVSYQSDFKNPLLLINHYHLQSKEYWQQIKMPRGDVNCWHKDDARDMVWFKFADRNEIDDFRLAEQNKDLILKLKNINYDKSGIV